MAAGALLAGAVSCSDGDGDDDNINVGLTGKMEYANFNKTSDDNSITFTYDFLTGGKVYYHLIYKWEFDKGLCTKCTITYQCTSAQVAQLVYNNFDEQLQAKSQVSGSNIIIDMTDSYENATKNQVDTLVTGMQESLEEQNQYLNK